MRPLADESIDQVEIFVIVMLVPERVEVGDRRDRNDRLEQRRVEHRRLQRGITAIRPADDRQRRRRGDSLLHQPAPTVIDVADRSPPRFEAVFAEPAFAIAGRSAIIGLQHRIAARGKELRKPVKAPFVAVARPAMRHDNRGKVGCRLADGQGQVARDHRTVGRRERDRLHGCERGLRKRRPHTQ